MILYHGTNVEFEKIDLLKSKPNKDFGRGFYLSPFFEQAKDMAETKVEQLEYGNPIVFQYEVKEEDMADLRILRFDSYSEEWAKFILANRNNKSEKAVHDYDIVIGPIADDKVGLQLWRYEIRSIDLPTLVRNLQYMKGVTIQYFFGTERAINILRRV
ncbi:MAG: DUF3990 domain-containing protein [Bacteroidaceae bacterium]|nr:DUF3990 domain-containing protein [Bacteroides sp.]MBO5080194.1 DUF3990 domain-containing protein [Bacteroidaceae bacterium]MBQ2855709.1 DUF3990 domain-containing protein [Bacteroidaceae bacterium]MBQ4590275.1 DUF3990 domain-containing protein [Bacteroidaceae bacterium]